MLMDEMAPSSAFDSISRFFGKVSEITFTAEQPAKLAGTTYAMRRPWQPGQGECLVVEILHSVPPAVQGCIALSIVCLFHEAPALTVSDRMAGDDLLRCEMVDACGLDELTESAKLMLQEGG